MSSHHRGSTPLSRAAICVTLMALAALSTPSGVEALPPLGRLIGKPYTMLEFREDLECGGKFDRSRIATLTMVCRDCFNMYQEPELFGLCRQKCFTSEYFAGCLQALHIIEPEKVQEMHSTARVLKG